MSERPLYGPRDCYRRWHPSGHAELDRRTMELIHEEALKENAILAQAETSLRSACSEGPSAFAGAVCQETPDRE